MVWVRSASNCGRQQSCRSLARVSLPRYYLHNRERKLFMSQDIILVMAHLRGEESPSGEL